MKKVILLIIIILLGFTSCTTTGSFLGLATTGYVENRFSRADERISSAERSVQKTEAENRNSIEAVHARATKLEAELAGYRDRIEQLDAFLADFARLRDDVEALKVLASQVEQRLDSLPRETVTELANILARYLESE